MRVHVDIHLNMDGGKFEVRRLVDVDPREFFPDVHVLKTEASTTYCTAGQLRQLKTVLEKYLSTLPAEGVVGSGRKESTETS
ncbi:MAG TPA: hypothetical protein VM182_16950 [Terriglobia bacterium]|nr:hypothetical protein [Terriglobia bacterium]